MNIERPSKITTTTVDALNNIGNEQSKFKARFNRTLTDKQQAIFHHLEQADQLRSVVPLSNMLSGSLHITKAAASVITVLLKERPYQQLKLLDKECRYYSKSNNKWASLKAHSH